MTDILTRGAGPASVPHAVRRRRPPGRMLPLAALVTLQVLLLAWLTRGSWFFVDDFLFLAQAREEQLSLDFLRLPLFEHFSPVHRLLDFAFIHTFGLNWLAARVVLLTLVAACILAFHATARALLSSPRIALALTGLYGTSLLFVRNSTWWTGGVHLFVLTLFSLLTCLGYFRWYHERERRWWVLSVVAYAGALLSHEQAMLVPGYLVLATLFLLSPHPTLGSVLREWRTWLVYGAMTVLALLNYFTTYYLSLEKPSAREVGQFLVISLFEGVLPTFLGLKVPEAVLVSQPFTVALAAVVMAAVVLASLRRSRQAWRAWAFMLAAFIAATLPLGLGRIVTLGVQVGREPRYQTAVAFLVLFAVGAAFDRRWSPVDAARPARPKAPTAVGPSLVAALLVVYLVVHVRGANRVHDALWEPAGPEQFYDTFEDQARPIKAREGKVHVFPGTVSESVMPAWLAPYNRFEHALVLAEPSVRVGTRRQAFVVEPDGRLNPATFRPERSAPPAETDYRLEGMELGQGRPGGTLCATTTREGQVRLPVPPPPSGRVLAGTSFESSAALVAIFAEQDGAMNEVFAPAKPETGWNERYLDMPPGPVQALVFNVAGPGSICIRSAEIGTVASE